GAALSPPALPGFVYLLGALPGFPPLLEIKQNQKSPRRERRSLRLPFFGEELSSITRAFEFATCSPRRPGVISPDRTSSSIWAIFSLDHTFWLCSSSRWVLALKRRSTQSKSSREAIGM